MPEKMRAITVQPGVAGTLQLEEFKVPSSDRGDVLIRAVALGICGTDRDIIAAKYGGAPRGHERLIIGHESLGRVEEAPANSGLKRGELVVGVVRHPDPVPCDSCAIGEWDMCQNGLFTEHGINGLDGFGSELYRLDARFVIRVPESLGLHAVLVEPTSVVAKAWQQIERIGLRAHWSPRKVLITGAGPVGLLAAMLGKQRGHDVHLYDHNADGPKPALARDLGAAYHSEAFDSLDRDFDVVLECTGVPSIAFDAIGRAGPNGIVCLLSVSAAGDRKELDVGALNRNIVLGNRVVFGSVNANRAHYEAAITALAAADGAWLDRLITRRVPLDDWRSAFDRSAGDIKTVILFSERPSE